MNRIKEIREAKNLTLEQLAEKIGTSYQQIQKLEAKEPDKLKIGWLNKLADALQCAPEDLTATRGTKSKSAKLHPTDDVRVYERVVAAMHELQELGLRISGSKAASAIFATVAKHIQAELNAGRNPNEETIHGRITAEVKKLQTKMKN